MSQPEHNTRTVFTFSFFAFALGLMIATLLFSRTDKGDDQDALLSFYGSDISMADLPSEVASAYYDLANQHYLKQKAFLEGIAIQLAVEKHATKQSISEDKARQQLFAVTEPDESEVANFYEQNKAHITQPFFEIKDDIRNYLKERQEKEARHHLVDQLVAEGNLAVLIPSTKAPQLQINTAGYPTKGTDDAPVHIVEFADYQCPHCKHARESLNKVLETYKGQVKLTYMDFPINRSGISRTVAEGAVCADAQQQYWPYHNLAFDRQSELSQSSATDIAAELKLDMTKFNECLTATSTIQKVKASEQEAIRLSVHGTPTLFINGKKYDGANLDEALLATLEKILKP